MKVKISIKAISVFFVWLLLLSNPPFSFYLVAGFPHLILKLISFTVLTLILISKNRFILSSEIYTIVFILFLNFAFYIFSFIYHFDFSYISQAFPVIYVLILYFVIKYIVGLQQFVKSYLYIMITIGLMGFIAFFLGLVNKLPNLGFVDPVKESMNYLFTFSNSVYNRDGDFKLVRIAGYFDEPGTMAFYLTFALLLNQMSFKNRLYDKLLIFSGVFTFSLAFFFTLIVYLSFYPNWKKTYLRLSVILCALFFIITLTKDSNSISGGISLLTLNRLQESDNGMIQGDNRSIYFEQGIIFFKEKPLLGHGQKNVLTGSKFFGYDPSSFVGYLVFYGIIGTGIIFMFYLYQFFFIFKYSYKIDLFVLKLVFIELLLFIQRPLINVSLALLILIVIVELMNIRKYSSIHLDSV